MGRKARPALHGLRILGERMKQVRRRSGLSQMKLAKLIGFDPAHGYKYILRLEKGRVPNPTLRTVAAYIEACGAGWQSVADVLPSTGSISARVRQPLNADELAGPGPMSSGPRPTRAAPVTPPEPQPRRKDPRPMREQLRSQRIERRELHTRRFWSGAVQADAATTALLHAARIPHQLHRAYLAFTRSCYSTVDASAGARREVAEHELARLVPPAVAQGLDRKILAQIQSNCARIFRQQLNAG